MSKPKAQKDVNTWDLDFKMHNDFDLLDTHLSFKDLTTKYTTRMVLADGPAGTAKTYLAVMSALELLKKQAMESIIYIRSVVESASQKMGSLPGEVDDRNSVVIVDEAQNLTTSELVTILTRFGDNSKYIVVGDTRQSDINGKTGFEPIFKCFDNKESEDEGIYTFKFTDSDIVRSEILKFIIGQLDLLKT